MLCCCNSLLPFEQCCEPFLQGYMVPVTAIQLMRSRYSAFYLGHDDYINQTNLRPESSSQNPLRWVKLEVIECLPVKSGGLHIVNLYLLMRL